MLFAFGVPLGIGVVLGMVGVIIGVATKDWQGVSNIMTLIGLISFTMLLFGGPGRGGGRSSGSTSVDTRQGNKAQGLFGWSGRSIGGRGDGFAGDTARQQNRAQGLRFGVNCVLVGLPILVISIVMYFVHP